MPTNYLTNEKYRVRRDNVTCIGNLEGGAIVRITSIDSDTKMCKITNGYTSDIIPIKELEKEE